MQAPLLQNVFKLKIIIRFSQNFIRIWLGWATKLTELFIRNLDLKSQNLNKMFQKGLSLEKITTSASLTLRISDEDYSKRKQISVYLSKSVHKWRHAFIKKLTMATSISYFQQNWCIFQKVQKSPLNWFSDNIIICLL